MSGNWSDFAEDIITKEVTDIKEGKALFNPVGNVIVDKDILDVNKVNLNIERDTFLTGFGIKTEPKKQVIKENKQESQQDIKEMVKEFKDLVTRASVVLKKIDEMTTCGSIGVNMASNKPKVKIDQKSYSKLKKKYKIGK